MLKTTSRFLLACAVLAWSLNSLAQSLPPYNPVTDARLQNPEASNWLMYRGSYDSHGYSSLDQINRGSISAAYLKKPRKKMATNKNNLAHTICQGTSIQ